MQKWKLLTKIYLYRSYTQKVFAYLFIFFASLKVQLHPALSNIEAFKHVLHSTWQRMERPTRLGLVTDKMSWKKFVVTVSNCAFSSDLIHGQTTQKHTDHLRSPEDIRFSPWKVFGKEIQIILRLFLVIAMYCQANSSQFNQITQPPTLLAGWEGRKPRYMQ